jgi:homoserine kinase
VPATTANLGPGFDVLGLALDLRNELEAEIVDQAGFSLEIEGEGADRLPRTRDNLVYHALAHVFESRALPLPGLRLRLTNRIPLARGLGSSAATVVAAVTAAGVLMSEHPLPDALALATALEGHPDNAAPCLLGGLTAAAVTDSGPQAVSLPLHECWRVALAVPDFEVSTRQARAALPQMVPYEDAVFNLQRLALLTAALARGGDLAEATRDRLHQPYRAPLVPGLSRVLRAALEAGASGSFLSGAGPTVAALVDRRQADAQAVAEAMSRAFQEAGQSCRAMALAPDFRGALVW